MLGILIQAGLDRFRSAYPHQICPPQPAKMIANPVEHTLVLNSGRQPGADRHPRWGSDRLHTTPLPQDHNHTIADNTDMLMTHTDQQKRQLFSTRLNQALEAQTAGVLNQVLSDLPVRRIVRTDPQRRATRIAIARRGLQIHLIAYLAASVVMIGIWLTLAITAGAWYFWPVWPILGAGIGLFSHAMAIRCSVQKADRSKR
jgi:2TM domain